MKYNRQNRTENPLEVGGGGGDEAAWGQTSLHFVVKMLLQPPEMKFNKEKKR